MEPQQPPFPPRYELTLEELYQIIGELEVIRRKLQKQIETMTPQSTPPQR